MFHSLEVALTSLINVLPLNIFVFVASIIEEIIAPIPSPTVMMLAGSFAHMQEKTMYALVLLAVLGACGKVVGALVVYAISDKSEDVVIGRLGGFFGISHAQVESFGKQLGHGVRDYFLLTLLRALPFIPSVIISAGSGILKVPLKLFIISTFLGTIVRDAFYLYAGYLGTEILINIITQSSYIENIVQVVFIVVVGYVLQRLYRARKATATKE